MKIVLRVVQSIFNYMSDMVEFSLQYTWELKKEPSIYMKEACKTF